MKRLENNLPMDGMSRCAQIDAFTQCACDMYLFNALLCSEALAAAESLDLFDSAKRKCLEEGVPIIILHEISRRILDRNIPASRELVEKLDQVSTNDGDFCSQDTDNEGAKFSVVGHDEKDNGSEDEEHQGRDNIVGGTVHVGCAQDVNGAQDMDGETVLGTCFKKGVVDV
jgi:hypothetical protein